MNAIGQFVPGNSYLHQLDPRSKLGFVFVLMILIFLTQTFRVYGCLLFIILCAYWGSRIPLRFVLRSLKPIIILILLTGTLHLWLTNTGPVIWEWSVFTVHEDGLQKAGFVSTRLILLVLIASLLTYTTSPIDFIDGLERIFRPLEKVGIPSHQLALMMSIALRFIPILWDELEKIKKAQLSRGAELDHGPLWRRWKFIVPMFVPLFISIFRRSDELANAMEARGYHRHAQRTKFRELRFSKEDAWLLVLLVIILLGWLWLGR